MPDASRRRDRPPLGRSLVSAVLALIVAGNTPARGAPSLPEMGEASQRSLPPQEAAEIGAAFYHELEMAGLIVEDPLLADYIDGLGHRLASRLDPETFASAPPFRFFLVDDSSVNAFAVPGGYIGVHAGLMLAAPGEGELAAVMAHEIAHLTQHHLARAYQAATRYSLATAAAVLAAVLLGGDNTQFAQAAIATGTAANAQLQINFTRANEVEADRLGMQLLADAGFDPDAMAGMFALLERSGRYYGQGVPEFLRTHPVTSNRLAEARARAASLPARPPQDPLAFELMRARLRVRTAANPLDTVQDFRHRIRNGQSAAVSAARYGLALALAESGEITEARKVITQLVNADPGRLAFRLAAAHIALLAGDTAAMAAAYSAAVALFPTSRPLVLSAGADLIEAGRAAAAARILEDYDRSLPGDPSVQRLLSRAAAARGQPMAAAWYLSQYHYYRGEYEAALAQLRKAAAATAGDGILAAKIAARRQELEERIQPEASHDAAHESPQNIRNS